jgi:hypothetical protein
MRPIAPMPHSSTSEEIRARAALPHAAEHPVTTAGPRLVPPRLPATQRAMPEVTQLATQLAVQQASRPSPLALWHLLSLDAPSVAAVWTLFIARCAGTGLPWTAPAAMFIAVWMLYAADRLLDARPGHDGTAPPELEERHRFHHRHRGAFLSAMVVASGLLAALLDGLDPRALRLYALLATLLAAWLLLIHARPLPTAAVRRLPKELAVGVFFSAAVFIPTVARAPQLRPAMLPAAVLLAAVCTLNCLFLYAWEHVAPRLQAHWTTRWATGHLGVLAAGVTAAAALTTALSALRWLPGPDLGPALACGLSAAALLVLDRRRGRFQPVNLRACADLVLLTPLVVFVLPGR